MKKVFCVFAACAMGACAMMAGDSRPVVEEVDDDPFFLARYFSFQTELHFYSAYVWRGRIICDRPVWQPAQDVYVDLGDDAEYGRLKARVWADFYINGHRPPHRFGGMSIVDETVSYSKTLFEDFDFEVGHIGYQYPNRHASGMRDTDELFAGVRWRNPYITPKVYVWWDYDTNSHNAENCLFFDFDFSHSFEITKELSLNVGGGFGVANGPYMDNYTKGEIDGPAFNYFHNDVALYYKLTEWLKVGGSLSYIYSLSRQVRHSNYDLNDAYNAGILRGGVHFIANF